MKNQLQTAEHTAREFLGEKRPHATCKRHPEPSKGERNAELCLLTQPVSSESVFPVKQWPHVAKRKRAFLKDDDIDVIPWPCSQQPRPLTRWAPMR